MITLTGFADEVSQDFGEQLALMNDLRIAHIEMRSAWGTKVLDLDERQLKDARSMLRDAGVNLSAVGSDLGKIRITDPFEDHLKRAAHAMDVCEFYECPRLRTFSFFMPEGEDFGQYRDEVLRRLEQMVAVAEKAGVTFLHENEKDIFGDVPERCVDLVTSLDSGSFRLTFDPANYVQCGVKPADEALPMVQQYTDYVHIKDARASDSAVVPAGEGDGQVSQVIRTLADGGYDGFLSIEPHLGDFDAFGGLCGPDLWTTAHTALITTLTDLGLEYA